jgi:hypothetical protein
MDWNFLVGIGTIILALATILYVYQSRLQTQILTKQINLLTGQQIPRLFIKQIDFEANSLKLEIQNITNVPAFWMGLETNFYVIGQRLYPNQNSDTEISWGEAVKLRDEGKTIYEKYFWSGQTKLKFQDKEVDTDTAISFFSPQGASVYLPPNSTIQVTSRPIFLVSWKENQGLKSYKGFEYSEFREFLLYNNIRAAAIVLTLTCKDSAEIEHSQGYAASFVLRTDLDHSLIDSSKNTRRFDFIPLSHDERLSGDSWTPNDSYNNTFSNWHVF